MGEVINTKTSGDKIIYRIELNEKEALQLKNHVKRAHLFAGNLCQNKTTIIERGNNNGTKYFIIPLSLRTRKKKRYNKATYQKIETDDKIYYIYVVEKDPLFL